MSTDRDARLAGLARDLESMASWEAKPAGTIKRRDAEWKDLADNVRMMEVHDVLRWDTQNLHYAGTVVNQAAREARIRIVLKNDPPLRPEYSRTPGRLTVERVS